MKKLALILLISTSFLAGVFAQEKFENNPRVKELRKKFYAKELQLTDTEAKAFWPLFEAASKEQKALRRKYKPNKDIGDSNDAEAKKQIENKFVYEEKRAELKKKHFNKFSEVLPVRKAAKIEATERKFKREVLKRVRENRKKRN